MRYTMKAVQYNRCGDPEELHLTEVAKPAPKADEVLVKIHATGLNGSDVEMLRGIPLYGKISGAVNPSKGILGSDIAGEVVEIGNNVSYLQIGDPVFGDILDRWGGLAEYVAVKESRLMLIPPSLTYEEAAALPQSAVIALQAIRDHGKVTKGQNVLINGAGGSAGLYAIQMAKSMGAIVTAVDNTHKESAMRKAGADRIVDYTQTDCTTLDSNFDFILDLISYRSIFDFRRILGNRGIYALVGGGMKALWQALVTAPLLSLFSPKKQGMFFHKPNNKDLFAVTELIDMGILTPVIDSIFPIEESAQAFDKMIKGESAGKVVIRVSSPQ